MILKDVINPLSNLMSSSVIFIYVCVSHYLSTTRYFVCIYLNVLKWRWKKEKDFWNQFDPIFEFTSSSRPDTREIQLIWIFKKSEFVWPCNFLSAIYFVLFSKIFKTNSGVKRFRHFDSTFSFHIILRKLRVDTDCWFILGIDTTNVSWIY